MSRIAVYSGTFDPITLGHEDLLRRAAGLFDDIILAVSQAHSKKTLFSLTERMSIAQTALQGLSNVRVLPFNGLIMDFCAQHGAVAVLRGIRNTTDFNYEQQMAAMNHKLRPQVETIFMAPAPDLACISATLVREISKLGGDVRQMVSPSVAQALQAAFDGTVRT